jgi:hypothetical protein
MSTSSSSYYGIQLLDDLHTYFPAILYNPRQFHSVNELLDYIQIQTRNHFDRFSNAQRTFVASTRNSPPPPVVEQPQVPLPLNTQPQSSFEPRLPSIRIRTTTPLHGRLNPLLRVLHPLSTSEGEIGGGMTADIIASLLSLGATMDAAPTNFMDPVPVVPSLDQIQLATSLHRATVANELVTCSICQDNFTSGEEIRRINHCNHEFHRRCIDTWFQTNVACPMCRWDIRGQEGSESSAE